MRAPNQPTTALTLFGGIYALSHTVRDVGTILPQHAHAALAASTSGDAFAAAWAAYQPYSDPSFGNGLGDEVCDAWRERQLKVTGRLAEAKAVLDALQAGRPIPPAPRYPA